MRSAHYFRQVIDCVVGGVVEQVYSGAVTCSRDNTSVPCNALFLPQNAPDHQLGELTALPQIPSWIKGGGKEGRKGERPPLSEVR